jgi:hypothetical protein
MRQRGYFAGALPKLHVMTVYQPLGGGDGALTPQLARRPASIKARPDIGATLTTRLADELMSRSDSLTSSDQLSAQIATECEHL